MPCLYLALLLACVTAAQSIETGLTERPSNADTRCSESILSYTCYTAGRGATEVTLNNEMVQGLQISHPRYSLADASSVNQSSPDGNINAGNLSRSQTQECSDELANGSASFCFRTVINVHLTDQTRCKTIGCRTTLRTDGVNKFVYYGNATIARQPPAPRNLRNTTESDGTVTFTWDPGSSSCSNAHYFVSTSNCGSCGGQNISTTYTNITCSELVPKQQCRIAVQSVLECGVPSEAETLDFVIEAAAMSTAKPATGETANVGAIVGGVLGGGLALIGIIVFVTIVGVITGRRKQGSVDLGNTKRSGVEEARKDTHNKQEEEEEIQRSQEEPPNNKMNESVVTTVTVEDSTIETKPLLSSPPNKSTPTETPTETLHLHQISSGSNSTAADGDQNALIEAESYLQNDDTKVYTPQSSEESRVEVAEESSGDDVNLKSGTANFVAISQSKAIHSGMPSPRVYLEAIDEESPPTSSTTRGMEPLQIGLRSTFENFSGPMGDDRELEEASETTVTVAETVRRQDPPKKSYGLSEQGMLLSQANFDDDKEPTTPVPPTDNEVNSQPKFAGITQYTNVAGSSQMADISRRLEQLECGKEEQDKQLKEQKKEIKEQNEKIDELKTSQEEHKCQMEMSQLKINELEAKARKSDLKVESLLSKVEQLSKDLQEMEKRNAELVEANITEKAKHQEEVEKLQQKHQEETETLKQEMEAVKTELEDERTKSRLLKEELEQERKKVVNFEKMMKSHESSSLGQLGSGNPKLLSLHSCPA